MTPRTMVLVAILVVLAVGAGAWYVYSAKSTASGAVPKFTKPSSGGGTTLGDAIQGNIDKGSYTV